jgi:trehalose 6-phosphate synthase/phosphatase
MAQVIIVSNRLPMSVKKVDGVLEFFPSLGGLATGLSSYVKDRSNIWVGWPGINNEELTETDRLAITHELAKHHCHPVFLSKKQVDDYYNGYSNDLLWPLMHTMPVTSFDNQSAWLKTYRNVNKLFADTVLSLARTDSTIWVHDYQLLLVPEILREDHIKGQIGFFLHIPFPKSNQWQKIGAAKQLLAGVLGADLVGFHTTSYATNFLNTCENLKLGAAGNGQFDLPTRVVQVTKFPIGVDYKKYARARRLKAVQHAVKKYRRRYGNKKIIVAVDRLEPSKGLIERLKAYRDFLQANPKFLKKVVMVMVAAPSRMELKTYQQLAVNLRTLSEEINAQFGTVNWQPVDYIQRPLPFEEVSALYQIADVAFIAPLRDGMNLVAKEYVATKQGNGVLILGQNAGAAEELRDALIVNPNKPATVIAALKQSLTMPQKELKTRLKNMQTQVAGNTIHMWANTFVGTLNKPVPGTRPRTHSINKKLEAKIKLGFQQSPKRLLVLDYDGTLAPFTDDYDDVAPSRQVLSILKKLALDIDTTVIVVSGRRAPQLEKWFGELHINLVAEHGAMIKKAGHRTWKTIEDIDTDWKKQLLPILERYAELTPKASVEIKSHALVWHYRASPPYYAQKYAVTLKHVLKPYLKKFGVKLYQGNKILEIKNPIVNKGAGIAQWLNSPYDFIVIAGDDYTDEDMFRALHGRQATTIKVGSGKTLAKYRVSDSKQIIAIFKSFVRS